MCVFQDLPGPFLSIFLVFPGLFNQMNMEQARFSYTFAESINESTKHVAHNVERVTQFTIILNNRLAVYAKAENVDGSKMQQPFGLFYIIRFFMTFQDLGLIP